MNKKPYPKGVKRPRKTVCQKNRDWVLQLSSEGLSLKEIGRRVGTNGNRVREFLDSEGVVREYPTTRFGEKNGSWKGGRRVNNKGYVYIRSLNHPNRNHNNYVLEHRLVMEAMIGRYLLPKEVVHHKDGNKGNNSPENLQLFSENKDHLALDLKGRVPKWTAEGLSRMREGIDRSANRRRGTNDWHWRNKLKLGVPLSR